MKANEAPERLYLSKNIYSTYLYQVPDPDDETAVEYTRTDAFIENAVKWLDGVIFNYIELKHANIDEFINIDNDKFIEDFKQAMKS